MLRRDARSGAAGRSAADVRGSNNNSKSRSNSSRSSDATAISSSNVRRVRRSNSRSMRQAKSGPGAADVVAVAVAAAVPKRPREISHRSSNNSRVHRNSSSRSNRVRRGNRVSHGNRASRVRSNSRRAKAAAVAAKGNAVDFVVAGVAAVAAERRQAPAGDRLPCNDASAAAAGAIGRLIRRCRAVHSANPSQRMQ